ncbi:hypothetical protein AB4Z25_17920 [Rhizobium sp. RAF36]|jgi:hypothetical protein|uniref:hypothetical protein n=1 Tax=Rhizobium sp. RAF36 TaxID=3233055 RepID=UPI003F9A11C2
MSTTTTVSQTAEPFAFWKSSDFIHKALDHVYDAADNDVQQVIDWLTENATVDETQPIDEWSLALSSAGVQIERCGIDQWIQGNSLDGPHYLYQFSAGDTVGWLLATIEEHRDSLRRVLVNYAMRDVGYQQTYLSNSFIEAIERIDRKDNIAKLAADDAIPW